MESSGELFKKNLDKAFSQISLNQSTLGDHMKYKQGFKNIYLFSISIKTSDSVKFLASIHPLFSVKTL